MGDDSRLSDCTTSSSSNPLTTSRERNVDINLNLTLLRPGVFRKEICRTNLPLLQETQETQGRARVKSYYYH